MGGVVEDQDGAAVLVVRRGTAAAVVWSLLGLLLTCGGLLLVANSGGHPLAWLLLVLSLPAGAWFAAQLLLPAAVSLELDAERIRARTFGLRTCVEWDRVHLARVRRIVGEPVLELEVRDTPGYAPAGPRRQRLVLLPVGADLAPLYAFLEGRLGRAPYARPH